MIHITVELNAAIRKVFLRFEKQGCVAPWEAEPTADLKTQAAIDWLNDTCAVLVDAGITVADITAAYGALMGMECIRFRRWPSNGELRDTINSRKPTTSEAAIQAEATGIFQRIVDEVSSGRARDLEGRVMATYGPGAAEALAAVGGAKRVNSAGEEHLGAVWNAFQTAYCEAVSAGRKRGEPLKALPPPDPIRSLKGGRGSVPLQISAMASTPIKELLAPKPPAEEKRSSPPPVDPEVSLARLRAQAATLLAEETSKP